MCDRVQPQNKEQVQKQFLAFGKMISWTVPTTQSTKSSWHRLLAWLGFLEESAHERCETFKRLCRKILWNAQPYLTQYLVDEVDVLRVGVVTTREQDVHDRGGVWFNCGFQGVHHEAEAVVENDIVHGVHWRENNFKFVHHALDMPGQERS